MPNDPIRYTGGPGTGRSATEILVRLRRDSVPQHCRANFEDLPGTFKDLINQLPPPPRPDGDQPTRPSMAICPVFLDAAAFLPKKGEGFVGRLIQGVEEYLPEGRLLRFDKPESAGSHSEGDLLNLLTNFRLRFSDATDAQAAFKKLQREPSVMKVEWSPRRVIAVTVLRGEAHFDLESAAPAARPRTLGLRDTAPDQADTVLHGLAEIRDLLRDMKKCACDKAASDVPGEPDSSYADWGRVAIDRPDDPKLGDGIVLAMLDLGVDHTHPDLKNRIIHGLSIPVDPNDQVMRDGTLLGRAAALHPFRPRGHHGTAVAGIMAGTRTGVLPKAHIVSFQVAAEQPYRGQDALGREVLYYPVDQVLYNSSLWTLANLRVPDTGEVTVLNMSIGGEAPLCEAEEIALKEVAAKGILLVAAAGNHSRPGDFSGVMYPARNPLVLSVGAVGIEGNTLFYKHAAFSNFDDNDYLINVVAPGSGIYFPVPYLRKASGYGWGDGTSFASPYVSAMAAHAIQKLGSYEPRLHSVRLKYQKADRGYDERHGWGLAKWPRPASGQ